MSHRLDYEDCGHERRPHEDHRVHPPESGIGEGGPEAEPPGHPEPARPGKRDRPAHLARESVLNALEQRPARCSVFLRACKRERDEGHEGDAANPVRDAKHMQSAGDSTSSIT
jgi:hypothetical protein